MKTLLAENAGFCFGVKRATGALEDLLSKNKSNDTHFYTLGALIHNPVYTASLEAQGVRSVTTEEALDIANLRSGSHTLLIRTHGVARDI